MKLKHLSLMALAAAALLASCAKEPMLDIEQNGDMIPLNISSSITQKHTKATAEGFVDKDALGLFAVNYTENNTVAGILKAEGNQADNVKYVFDEANYKWNPVKAVYYKDVNTHADLYAYYPYQASIKDVNAANFEVKKDQSAEATATALSGYEASDFLWGKAEDITPTQSAIAISLSHKLSAVEVKLVEGTGFAKDEFASLEKSVILTSTTRKATIDYATGEATALGGPQLDGIVMCPQTDGSWRAIVIPQAISAGAQLFAITVNGMSYKFSRQEVVTYQAGKQMSFDITVNKKTPAGDLEFTLAGTQITDWVEDRNTHGGEARQYFVVNVTEPGTLGKTIKAMGKNPDKIKNLKVTGQITTEDFNFMRDNMAILEAVNLKEVKLKDDVIPDSAFEGKSSLYYFVFPEKVTSIALAAFNETNLSGALIIPEDVIVIEDFAFQDTNISSITFPNGLIKIGQQAFNGCSSLSSMILPETLTYIGRYAFGNCSSYYSQLLLPKDLEYLGAFAFSNLGTIIGDLSIPEKIVVLQNGVFYGAKINGSLHLSGNVTEIMASAFDSCGIRGEIVFPNTVTKIWNNAFCYNNLSTIILPESIKTIGERAFQNNNITGEIIFPEGLLSIGKSAFDGCNSINALKFPSTLQTIHSGAFANCYSVSSIVCSAEQVPIAAPDAFIGIPKDNFTVEVPAQSISQYQAANGWSDFRRISAHYDFSISRNLMRGLNASKSRTYILRCPANYTWSIESKPDWVTVSPDHGTGKTDVTITFTKMDRTSDPMMNPDNIYEQIGVGRNGEIVFKLNEKDYTSTMTVEQYDSDYQDGEPITIQTATKGNGIDIVFIGDGYDARDIANGVYIKNDKSGNVDKGYDSFFDIEPYKTYKDYFNVYAVISESDDSGIGSVNTVKDSKFGSYFTSNRILAPNPTDCFNWAKKAKGGIDFTRSLVIMLQNASVYEGVCMMYGDGSAVACCPVSTETYPYDFRGIIQHEAGGHGFGKLADEYIYHNAFIQNCDCPCCEHPQSDEDLKTTYGIYKSNGWFKNLSMNSDSNLVPWSHLLYNPQYSDYVDMFEGGYMHTRGIYRSEATSCMNNNIPYYSAISRQAIVERIMEYAGEEFTLEKFYAKDSKEFGTRVSTTFSDKYIPEMIPSDGRTRNLPVYMGEHPEL